MNDDERAAREWLLSADGSAAYRDEDDVRHRTTILRLLDRPVLPEGKDVPDDVATKIADAFWRNPKNSVTSARAALDVLHAHLTAPPQPKAELWAVKASDGTLVLYCQSREQAERVGAYTPGRSVVRMVEAADDQ